MTSTHNSYKKIVLAFLAVFALAVSFFALIDATKAYAQCSDDECFPPVQGSCYATVSSADIGETVTFRTSVSGGNGFYSFSWSGTDNLAGNGPSVLKSYNSAGTKIANVQITSYGRTITRTCTVVIEQPVSNLNVSCSVNDSTLDIGQSVTYTANATGGTGSYSYSWSGSENLSGSNRTVNKSYASAGNKIATVTVISGNDTETATCNVTVLSCSDDDCFPPLAGSCSANVSNADIGETVTFRTSVSGGNGFYSFSWSGTDNLAGNGPTVSRSYSSSGTKVANVIITSNGRSITRTCDVQIDTTSGGDLGGRCEASNSDPEVGDTVTWRAYPTGGNGSYAYDWSGDDGLDGNTQSVSERYYDEGTKDATVRITSNGQTITRSCSVRIDEEDEDEDLDADCEGSPSRGRVGERIRWTVDADGGDGDFDYDWDGDEGLRGDDRTVYNEYDTPGRKEAEVRVTSDGDRVTARCSVIIEDEEVIVINNDGGIFLSTIPATGISPTLKTGLFIGGISIWSAFLGYLYIARRNEKKREREILETIEN